MFVDVHKRTNVLQCVSGLVIDRINISPIRPLGQIIAGIFLFFKLFVEVQRLREFANNGLIHNHLDSKRNS